MCVAKYIIFVQALHAFKAVLIKTGNSLGDMKPNITVTLTHSHPIRVDICGTAAYSDSFSWKHKANKGRSLSDFLRYY